MIYEDTRNTIFSQESAGGAERLSLLDGQKAVQSGRAHAHVSHSAQPENKKVNRISATYGPHGSASLKSIALQQSLQSKLLQALPKAGWTASMMTWKQKTTPSGRQYCQLAVSAPRTGEKDYGLWATPNTMDILPPRSQEAMRRQFNTTRKGRTAPSNLREQVIPARP